MPCAVDPLGEGRGGWWWFLLCMEAVAGLIWPAGQRDASCLIVCFVIWCNPEALTRIWALACRGPELSVTTGKSHQGHEGKLRPRKGKGWPEVTQPDSGRARN